MELLIPKAARDMVNANYGIALTGAGISTESGIRDFRGPSGVWTLNPEAERKAYQGYQEFMEDPVAWWQNRLAGSSEFSLGDMTGVMPNTGHYILVELETLDILKCTITQNIDGLHVKAGTVNLLEYHGSANKLRCTICGLKFKNSDFDFEKLIQENRLPPTCPSCQGIIKTDTVSFGEPIPGYVAEKSLEEAWKCDLMLICGTSAVVFPFASLPRIAKQRGTATIIEVNAEPTPLTEDGISDYFIQGKTGEVLPRLLEEVKKIVG
ncbi:NAD-dependent deacetylase [Chloroflexota bacterium]